MFTQGRIVQGQLVFDAVIDRARDADSSSLSQPFDTCGDINSVSVDPLFLFNYISEVDTDTKYHLAVFR